ncbi:MAG: response regulator [Thermodesulfobacteriota bacterium]
MRRARILVVDDAPRNAKLLADLLDGNGYDVAVARSGRDALEQVAATPPDVILLDVVMPGMSGYDVCRTLRADPATRLLPIVMVTALEASDERVRGIEAGADDFLSKPISQPELLARVRSLVRTKELHDRVQDQARQLAEWNATLEERVARQVAELERLRQLKRFLPPQVAERVVAGSAEDPLTSHRRDITVVSLELRGFTTFAETTAPEEVMAVLQEHHRAMGQLVTAFEGTLERFTGEAMRVFFNDPVAQPDATDRAVRMALAMQHESQDLVRRWSKRGFELGLACGISQGYATLGAIGFEARADYAAVGTVTDMAARLCEAAGPGEILITRRVLAAVEDLVDGEPAGKLTLRGFLRPVAAFRVAGALAAAAAGDDGASSGPLAERVFRHEGEYWWIAYDHTSFRLKDSKGLRYVARLLRHPEHEFHALDLVALARDGDPASDARFAPVTPGGNGLGDAGTVLDASARAAYRSRLEELREQRAEVEAFNDPGRVAGIEREMQFLADQLASAIGLGGRDRRVAAAAERARVNVTRAITDGIKRIRAHCPPLARYFEASIRTGTFCSYRPADTTRVHWRL